MLMAAKQRSATARIGTMVRTKYQGFGRLDDKKVDGKYIRYRRGEVDDDAVVGEADDDSNDATEHGIAF